jgi:hypothetical protein
MPGMKSVPRLRIEPRASRVGPVVLATVTIATGVLVACSVAEPTLCVIIVAFVAALGLRAVRKMSRPPPLLWIGIDRRVTVTMPDGRVHDGSVHSDTSVGACLTTLVWVRDGARWFVPARTLVVLPDMLPAEDFRNLRVYLRYGRDAADPDTSGVVAR